MRFTPMSFANRALLVVLLVLVSGCPKSGKPAASAPAAQAPNARNGHTLTRLPDGRVLVAGGTFTFSTADSYVWKPDGGTTPLALVPPRMAHTATLLQSGKVLLAGGIVPPYDRSKQPGPLSLRVAQLFDPTGNTLTPTGQLQFARDHHSATLLDDGRVLVAGGASLEVSSAGAPSGHAIATCEIWSPGTGQWVRTGDLKDPRFSQVAVKLGDGRVMVVGGTGLRGALASAEIWDPKTGAWTPTAPMIHARSTGPVATLLRDGRVLVIGGRTPTRVEAPGGKTVSMELPTASTELYDPKSNTWTPGPELVEPRSEPAVATLEDGSLILLGGLSAPRDPAKILINGPRPAALASAERFDPSTMTFAPAPAFTMSQDRTQALATSLGNGRILVVGGISKAGADWELLTQSKK